MMKKHWLEKDNYRAAFHVAEDDQEDAGKIISVTTGLRINDV